MVDGVKEFLDFIDPITISAGRRFVDPTMDSVWEFITTLILLLLLPFLGVGVLVLLEGAGSLWDSLAIRLGPRCRVCGKRALRRYNWHTDYWPRLTLYHCKSCGARFKKQGENTPERLPQSAAGASELASRLGKPVTLLHLMSRDLPLDLFASCFGRVRVALPGEEWPSQDGIPMIPLCQINCKELPFRPPGLADIALLTVFVSRAGGFAASPNGSGWLLRAYPTLDGLTQFVDPGDPERIQPSRIQWENREADFPKEELIPEELRIDWLENLGQHRRLHHAYGKVGGWPTTAPSLPPDRAEFVFQVETTGRIDWRWGMGNLASFSRGIGEDEGQWYLDWTNLFLEPRSRGAAIRLGCEKEGVHLYTYYADRWSPAYGVVVEYRGQLGLVRDLNHLKGLVRNEDGQAALRFVRLRTSDLMRSMEAYEWEVISRPDCFKLPFWNRTKHISSASGLYGVLDPKPFLQGGFQPPAIEPLPDGFAVTRWTYTPGTTGDFHLRGGGTVQRIQEQVSSNGLYERTVLEQKAAPLLPHTTWGIHIRHA